MTEFCEQVNPRVLLEMRRTRPYPDMLRVQESWIDATEKRACSGWPRALRTASAPTISPSSDWPRRSAQGCFTRSPHSTVTPF